MTGVRVFLPCRKGSERVPKKNIRPFAGYQGGLLEIKLKQLLSAKTIDEIVLSTNDEEILSFADSLGNPRLRIHERSEHLCASHTSTDDLVQHARELIPEGHILWTHVTSPFLNERKYDEVVGQYFSALDEGYDSLMSTTLIQGFLWDENGPVNYDRRVEKWPRTQTIRPLHEINSGVFLSSAENYNKFNDRIGIKPFLCPIGKIASFDIDWPDDFQIAENMASQGVAEI